MPVFRHFHEIRENREIRRSSRNLHEVSRRPISVMSMLYPTRSRHRHSRGITVFIARHTVSILLLTHRCMYDVGLPIYLQPLTRDIDIVILSVCLSVCLSVHDTLVLYENGLTYRHSFSTIR